MLKGSLPALSAKEIMDKEASFFQRDSSVFKQFSQELETDIREIIADVNAITQALLDMRVTDLGQDMEGAMDVTELNRVATVFLKLRQVYGAEFTRKGGTQAILKELIDYIAAQAGRDCLTSPDKRRYKKSDPKNIQIAKSALRSLLDPAPNSKYGNYLHNDESKWTINGERVSPREILAYFVLAAFDPNMPLDAKDELTRANCLTAEKNLVVYYVGDIRRAHNRRGDNRPEDHEIDEPSCFPGTIGRMGTHLHSLHTVYDAVVLPHKHYYRKMRAFIIDYFKKQPFDAQIQIMTAINKRIMFVNDDESDLPFNQFMASLLTKSEIDKFGDMLQVEFGTLDSNQFILAGLYFIDTLVKMFYRFDTDLHQRLEEATLKGLTERIKGQVERDLERVDLSALRKSLLELYEPLERIKRNFLTYSKSKASYLAVVSPYLELQQLIESQQKEYADLMKLKDHIMAGIQKAAMQSFKRYFEPYRSYFEVSGRQEFLKDEYISQIELMPYWLKKFELSFVEVDSACKFAYLTAMRNLIQFRRTTIFAMFLDDFSEKSEGLKLLQDLEGRLESILSKCWHFLQGKKSIDFVASLTECRQVMANISDFFMTFMRSYLQKTKMPNTLEDEGFFKVALSDSILLKPMMIYPPSMLSNLFLRLNDLLEDGVCLLKVLPESLRTLTEPSVLSPSAAAAAASAPVPNTSDKKAKSGLSGLLSKLTLNNSSATVKLSSEEKRKIDADYSKEKRAISARLNNLSPQVESNLINTKEERYAREHILAHARSPGLLSLERLLTPDTVVDIMHPQSDPIQVAFTTFKDGREFTEICPMTVSTLKSYAEMRFKKISDLMHTADLLSSRYLSEIEAQGEAYRNVYLMELHEASNHSALFKAALEVQTIADLNGVLETLNKHIARDHKYQVLCVPIRVAILGKKERHSALRPPIALEAWESKNRELSMTQLHVYLEEVAYVQRPKLK